MISSGHHICEDLCTILIDARILEVGAKMSDSDRKQLRETDGNRCSRLFRGPRVYWSYFPEEYTGPESVCL